MNKNDTGTIFINQGKRRARCLETHGDRALVEYFMPNGSSAILEIPAAWGFSAWPDGWRDQVKNVQPKRAPMRWKAALVGYE